MQIYVSLVLTQKWMWIRIEWIYRVVAPFLQDRYCTTRNPGKQTFCNDVIIPRHCKTSLCWAFGPLNDQYSCGLPVCSHLLLIFCSCIVLPLLRPSSCPLHYTVQFPSNWLTYFLGGQLRCSQNLRKHRNTFYLKSGCFLGMCRVL